MRKVLVVLLILAVVGVVAADRIGVRIAEDRIAREVATQTNAGEPDVTIHGIPFLTQVLGGEYKRIEMAIGDWTEQDVTVNDVRIDMHGVTAPLSEVAGGDTTNVAARTATVSAVIPYSLIKKHAPKEVQRIGPKGDNLSVDMTGSFLGLRLSGTAVVEVKPAKRGVAVSPVSVGDGMSQVPVAVLKRQLTWVVPVPELPLKSQITQIEPTDEGLRIGATAENVRLSDLERLQR